MAQERLHIDELNGLGLQDYRNIPKIAEILCEQNGMTNLWWFILGQVHHESLIFSDTKRDYKGAAPFYNIMGMRPAKVRDTYQMEGSINGKNQYAQYANYADAIADLLYWLKINKIPEGFAIQLIANKPNYAQLLKAKKYMTGSESGYNNGIIAAQNAYGTQWNKWREKPFFDGGVVTEENAGSTTQESANTEMGMFSFLNNKWVLMGIGALVVYWYMTRGNKPMNNNSYRKFRR